MRRFADGMLLVGFGAVAGVWLACASARGEEVAVPRTLHFEAEEWTTPKDAWRENTLSEDKWDLWSKDSDAMRKWSNGIVLRSPVVEVDRETPEAGAPPLHTRITGIPLGKYEVSLKLGRTLAVSLDGGGTWARKSGADAFLGLAEVTDGSFELWVDDRYAHSGAKGPSYYDTIIFSPLWPQRDKPPVRGFARQRVREHLGRGLVAMRRDAGTVYLGWRLLADDPPGVAFNVYRSAEGAAPRKLNREPLRRTTDFVDREARAERPSEYTVRPLTGSGEGPPCPPVRVQPGDEAEDCISFKLDDGETFQKVGIGDLDGDGSYDYVIKQPSDNIDPGSTWWKPSPDTYKIEAYTHDGERLWRRDLGWAIERGIWYSPYIVFDLDGDGRAEVAAKTGEGDPRGKDGRVESGPEFLSIWDGRTGEEITRTEWLSRQAPGDSYNYNLSSRNQICVAYLDGKTPCLIVARGTYTVIRLTAYEFRRGKLRKLWEYDNREDGRTYRGQGAHIMHAADVDQDGRDEIVIGSAVIDDNGRGLWSTGYGHPDYCFVGDIDPARDGLEIFYGIEPSRRKHALCLVDARTGELIWGLDEATNHVGSNGMCADIDPRHPGLECHASDIDRARKFAQTWMFSARGELISTERPGSVSVNAYWDADPQRELVQGSRIRDFRGGIHAPAVNGRVVAVADVLGDWREELITTTPGQLRIYSTTIPARDRRVCLMQDPIYRIDVAVAAMGYWAAPMLSTCISAETASLAFFGFPRVVTAGAETGGTVVVQAAAKRALRGKLSLFAPPNVAIAVDRPAVDIPRGGLAEIPFTVSVPRETGFREERRRIVLTARVDAPRAALRTRFEALLADSPVSGYPMAEAERFSDQGGGSVKIRTDKIGSSQAAISHWDERGHWLEWRIHAPRAGTFRLAVRYCTPDGAVRALALDGRAVPAGDPAAFPPTGGFAGLANDWAHRMVRDAESKALEWQLEAGEHTVRMTNTDGKGLNLDYLLLIPVQ